MAENGRQELPENFVEFAALAQARGIQEFGPDVVEPLLVGLLLRRAARLTMVDIDQESLRPADLTWTEYRVCFSLWVAGPQEPHRVALLGSMSRAAVSAARKKLVDGGYITATASENDQRSIVLALTEEGAERITRMYRQHLQITAEWLEPLSTPERQVLMGLLGKVMASPRASTFGPGRIVNS